MFKGDYEKYTKDDLHLLDTLSYNSEDDYPTLLLKSMITGNRRLAMTLIENEVRIDIKSKLNDNVLLLAVAKNDLEMVRLILDKCEELLDEPGPKNHTALTLSCKLGNIEIVKFLMAKGANVEHKTKCGSSPIIYASLYGRNDIIKLLLKNNVNIDMVDNRKKTALIYAAQYGHTKSVKKLLKSGADVNKIDNKGYTALMYACKNEHKEIVKKILEKDIDINYKINPLKYGNGISCILTRISADTLTTNKDILEMLNNRRIEIGLENVTTTQ